MPATSPSYLVGVIREKEKSLLSEDVYTRILGARSGIEAVRSMADTSYGVQLSSVNAFEGVSQALSEQALTELTWILDGLDKPEIQSFLTARYDALNIANSIISFVSNKNAPENLSPLGSISQDVLFNVFWSERDVTLLPYAWRTIVKSERDLIGTEDWSTTALLDRMAGHGSDVLTTLARTPLSKTLARIMSARLTTDRYTRRQSTTLTDLGTISSLPITKETSPTKVVEALISAGITKATEKALEDVQAGASALVYERMFDEAIVDALRNYRLEVVGYDPVIAYWFGREMERKTLRMVLSAKFSGVHADTIQELVRPLYQKSFA